MLLVSGIMLTSYPQHCLGSLADVIVFSRLCMSYLCPLNWYGARSVGSFCCTQSPSNLQCASLLQHKRVVNVPRNINRLRVKPLQGPPTSYPRKYHPSEGWVWFGIGKIWNCLHLSYSLKNGSIFALICVVLTRCAVHVSNVCFLALSCFSRFSLFSLNLIALIVPHWSHCIAFLESQRRPHLIQHHQQQNVDYPCSETAPLSSQVCCNQEPWKPMKDSGRYWKILDMFEFTARSGPVKISERWSWRQTWSIAGKPVGRIQSTRIRQIP